MSGRRRLDIRLRGLRDARQRDQNGDAQGPRLKFYTAYDREARAFDDRFADDCNTSLSDVFIFAGLLSTVNTFLAINASSYAQRDTGAETADFARAIFYTLNPSVIPEGDSIYIPPVWEGPTRKQRISSDLLFASFLLTLFASFLATLAKQWLVWYLKNSEASVTARCRERQRKRDGFDRWLFQAFVNGLPLLLQASLVLLGAGLIAFITTYSLTSAEVVIGFTALGAGTYILFTVPGALSRYSPFQTPISIYIRTTVGDFLRSLPVLEEKFNGVKKKLSRWVHLSNLQLQLPISIHEVDRSLGKGSTTNTDDAHCVSWILKNITDPGAIDAALRLAGVVRWFEGGCNSDPPYDYIVSIFKSCFDFAGSLDQKSKARAFYSATAILQVHISSLLHKQDGHIPNYPIPRVTTDRSKMNDDLMSVLDVLATMDGESPVLLPFAKDPKRAMWTSELLLWYATNERYDIATYSSLICKGDVLHYPWWHEFSPEVVNNFLLVWCVYLGWEIDNKAPRMRESGSMGEILEQLSALVLRSIYSYDPNHSSLSHLLKGLVMWKDRPSSLAHLTFDWCIAICEEIQDDDECTNLVFPALHVGFRYSAPGFTQLAVGYVPAGHQRMVELVFKHGDQETVADALCAWTSVEDNGICAQLVHPCVRLLVELAHEEFPPRLKRAIIHAVNVVDFTKLIGAEQFTDLLDRLKVGIDDIRDARDHWTLLILRVIASEVGREHLSLWYWELLVELVGRSSGKFPSFFDEAVLRSLVEKEEWEKLACWLGLVWSMQPPSVGALPVEMVTNATATLLTRIPTAAQRLGDLVVDSAEGSFGRIYGGEFKQVCDHWVGVEPRLIISHPGELTTELQVPGPVPSPVSSRPSSRATHSRRAGHSHRAGPSNRATRSHRGIRSNRTTNSRPAARPDDASPDDPPDPPDDTPPAQTQDSDSPPQSQPSSPTLSQSPSLDSVEPPPSPTLSQFSNGET